MTTSPSSGSHACAHEPDPRCVICAGTGVRHTQRKGKFQVVRDKCPCTILGSLQPSASRPPSELPPIKDTAVLDRYPDCQPRTPIDPVTTVRSPGLLRGNADLQPATWSPPRYRDCQSCMGKGTGRALHGGGNAACPECHGHGKVKL